MATQCRVGPRKRHLWVLSWVPSGARDTTTGLRSLLCCSRPSASRRREGPPSPGCLHRRRHGYDQPPELVDQEMERQARKVVRLLDLPPVWVAVTTAVDSWDVVTDRFRLVRTRDARRPCPWTHVWLSRHLVVGDVLTALAEVGLAPDADRTPYAPTTSNTVLIYRRNLTDDDVAMLEQAAALARARPR